MYSGCCCFLALNMITKSFTGLIKSATALCLLLLISKSRNVTNGFSAKYARNDNLTDQICVNDTVASQDSVPSVISCLVRCLDVAPTTVAVFFSKNESNCQCHNLDYQPSWSCSYASGYKFYAYMPPPTLPTAGTNPPAPSTPGTAATSPTPTGSPTTVTLSTASTPPSTVTTSPSQVTAVTTAGPSTTSQPATTVSAPMPAPTPSTTAVSPPLEWKFELVNGTGNHSGLLELSNNGSSAYVCLLPNFVDQDLLDYMCNDILKMGNHGFRLPPDFYDVNVSDYRYVTTELYSCNISMCDRSYWEDIWATGSVCAGMPLLLHCTSNLPENIRFVDGMLPDEGRVELQFAGKWGQICIEAANSDPNLANAVCRTNGYTSGSLGTPNTQTLWPASAYGPVFIAQTNCPSDPSTELSDCGFSFSSLCNTVNDTFIAAYFYCNPAVVG